MTKRTALFVILLFLTALILLYLSYFLVGRFTLKEYSLDSVPLTYTVESIILSTLGRNRLGVSRSDIKEKIETLPYVRSADVSVSSVSLCVSGEREDGLIVTDGENWYFYSDGLEPLSKKDVSVLSGDYALLRADSSLLESMLLYSPTSQEVEMMSTLMALKRSSNLITMAEYGNNKNGGYPLSLTLRLDSLSSVLIVSEISDAERIEEALELIENEYAQTGYVPEDETEVYVLSGGRLIETR